MQTISSFHTHRLVATRLQDTDLSELCRMDQDARVMATLGGTRTEERTRQYLRTNLDHWDKHGFGIWVFRAASDRSFVGRGGLRHVNIDGHDEVEVAYALMSEFWGCGLATEMARALLKIGFEQLALAQLVTYTLTTNQASRRVMEKVGFTFEREFVHGARGLPHVLYRIIRDGDGAPAIEEMWDRQAAAEKRYSTPYLDLTPEDVVAFAHGAPGPVAPGTVFPAQLLLDAAGKRVLCLASAGGSRRSCSGWPARA